MMRFARTTVVIVCLIVGGCADSTIPPASRDDALLVATWNVEWLYDEYKGDNFSDLAKAQSAPSRSDWEWKRDGVAAAIAEMAPHVMALQEVESRRTLSYLERAIERNHDKKYRSFLIEGSDVFTEQDVGLLTREIDVTRFGRREQTAEMFASDRYYNVSKQLEAELLWSETGERVHLFNLHLRASGERAGVRRRQARLVHAWLAPLIQSGANVIVLGDTNSETRATQTGPTTDLGALMGKETTDEADDLIDLATYLPERGRQTHLLKGKQFDRILVSRSLMEDLPNKRDLVFDSIRVRRDVAVRGAPDNADEHWEDYWNRPAHERDLSDHYPVIATFLVK